MKFDREFMGTWPELKDVEVIARWLQADYHTRTERFDRRICSGTGPDGTAMPVGPYERRQSVDYARCVKMEITSLASSYRIPRETLQEAKAWAVDHLKELMAKGIEELQAEAEKAILGRTR